MKKRSNKRQLTVLAIVFALVLVAGFAYAAIAGTLFFTGRATLYQSNEIELHFVEASTYDSTDIGSKGTLTLEPVNGIPNQRAVIDAEFAAEDDSLIFEFKVKNSGTRPAKITYIPMLSPDVWDVLIVAGTFRQLEGKVIQPGETITLGGLPFTISITMHGAQGETVEPGKTYAFEIGMEYEAAE